MCTHRARISGLTFLVPGKEKSQAGEAQIKTHLDLSPLKGWTGGQPSWLLGFSLPAQRDARSSRQLSWHVSVNTYPHHSAGSCDQGCKERAMGLTGDKVAFAVPCASMLCWLSAGISAGAG